MPHLTIEHSNNIPGFDGRAALVALNDALIKSGQFEEQDIKSRAVAFDRHLIGSGFVARAFVHAKLALLSGRSPEIKREISDSLLIALQHVCLWPDGVEVQLCVEIQEIDRDSYAKVIVG